MLRVRVTPRGTKNDLRLDGELIKVWVTAAPTGGQANEAVLVLLAKRLGIAKSRLALVSGLTGRDKTIEIQGMTVQEVFVSGVLTRMDSNSFGIVINIRFYRV